MRKKVFVFQKGTFNKGENKLDTEGSDGLVFPNIEVYG
jgi:hypothetical protein